MFTYYKKVNKIEWKRKALKQVKKFDHQYRVKIFDAVEELTDLKTCSNIKRLTNHDYDYRFRVGSYRVFFDLIDGEITIVEIQEVKKRDEQTY